MTNVNRAYGENDASGSARRRAQVAPERDTSEHQPQTRQNQSDNSQFREHIERFVTDDMGYLKIRRGLDTDDLHLTWQFSNGQHYGHYVYVRVWYWQIEYGLALLIQKRDEVYQGSRVPTPDKRNPSHK